MPATNSWLIKLLQGGYAEFKWDDFPCRQDSCFCSLCVRHCQRVVLSYFEIIIALSTLVCDQEINKLVYLQEWSNKHQILSIFFHPHQNVLEQKQRVVLKRKFSFLSTVSFALLQWLISARQCVEQPNLFVLSLSIRLHCGQAHLFKDIWCCTVRGIHTGDVVSNES